MKYRKKPVVIEAYQVFENDDLTLYPSWLLKEVNIDNIIFTKNNIDIGYLGHIRTYEGKLLIPNGSFIINNSHGELEICDSDIFKETYEKI